MDTLEGIISPAWLRQGLKRIALQLIPQSFKDPDRISRNTIMHAFLTQRKIDWVLHTTPNAMAFEMGIPYVMPIYDLQHRLQPEFEEVSAHGQWNRREYLYRNGARYATLVLADSEVGKEDIVHFYEPYGVTGDRVKVLPYLPAPYLSSDVSPKERERVRTAYALPERYLFYPAQLWPHKNHVRVVQAVGRLKWDKGTKVNVVLCGASSGADRTRVFNDVMREAHRDGILDQIHFLGYVPNEAMSALYAEATGLLMPTFFGPTNIPIVEAWHFGCPVLASDIRGIREQVGDAGLLIDPHSVEAIADGIGRLWEDDTLRASLTFRGSNRLAKYSRKDFCAKLTEIVAETNRRVEGQGTARNRKKYSQPQAKNGVAVSL
jgi:glycosyltransferase involved in cell wall biosynthesis